MSSKGNKYTVEIRFTGGAVVSYSASSWDFGDKGLNILRSGKFFMHIPYNSYLYFKVE